MRTKDTIIRPENKNRSKLLGEQKIMIQKIPCLGNRGFFVFLEYIYNPSGSKSSETEFIQYLL